ncbi:hypothetical protein [Ureibacillus chungkukjangi]|uniref:Uncharacterized protein n=1 Tax=Ureibacillus chungkukjangi TaxID=1202712 RepID=A0A318TSR6_9BACL|nr:hypothetical protein [Ureibacillus chungkukjangi]PYF07891.1 hypothetical protein BJ095_10358 [Ureibacillus chungkukjangi]
MYKKLVFKSKQEVNEFIAEMFENYGYETSFSSPMSNGISVYGEWVTIKLYNGFYHFLEYDGEEYIHYWTNGNTRDREISYISKDTIIDWLWEDRKYAFVRLNEAYYK